MESKACFTGSTRVATDASVVPTSLSSVGAMRALPVAPSQMEGKMDDDLNPVRGILTGLLFGFNIWLWTGLIWGIFKC